MDLKNLNPKLVIRAQDPVSTADQIASMLRVFPQMPKEYIDFVRDVGALYLGCSFDKGSFLRIWNATAPEEMNDVYKISKSIPGAIPIGDDGHGHALIYATGKRGYGMYLMDFGDRDRDSLIYVAPSFKAILRDGVGVETINHPHGPPPPRKPKARDPK